MLFNSRLTEHRNYNTFNYFASKAIIVTIALTSSFTIQSCQEHASKNQQLKDLSQIHGIWLAHDGDEGLYGKLVLRVTQDSVYYGERFFSDGSLNIKNKKSATLHITQDSLVLQCKENTYCEAWSIDTLNNESLVLKGDSYSHRFIKKLTINKN